MKKNLLNPKYKVDYNKNLINMIYKLLPLREENNDWKKYLESLIYELKGMEDLLEIKESINYARVVSKLNGLKFLENEKDFKLYRKIIFECINLIK